MATPFNSIIQAKKECYVCKTTKNLQPHEIFFGCHRQKSIHWGMQVWLCPKHHTLSNESVHHNHELDMELKRLGQDTFEHLYGHELFMKEFKKNYL